MILVIGATGTTGGEVARSLAAHGAKVRALVRNPAKAGHLMDAGVETVTGDLDHPESLASALRGVERVFLATSPDPRTAEIQIAAIRAARAAGVQHVVKISVVGAAKDSPVLLGRLHWETEEALKASGLAWTILQPNFFMQNMLASAQAIAATGVLHAPAADGLASQIDARDVAAAAVGALTRPGHQGRTFVLTGPEALSYASACEEIGRAIGRPVTYVPIPGDVAKQHMLAGGMPEWLADDLVVLLSVVYGQSLAAQITDAVQALAGHPPRRFEQFARDHADVFAGRR